MDRSMPFIKSLPARLGDARDQALVSQIAKLYARKSKLAVISAGAAGHLAPVPDACRVAVTGNFRHLQARNQRSEEHTSELQSLMRNSYAVFCLNKKKKTEDKRKNISK